MDSEEILLQRKNKFLSIGRNKGFTSAAKISDNLSMKTTFIDKYMNWFSSYKKYILIFLVVNILGIFLYFL